MFAVGIVLPVAAAVLVLVVLVFVLVLLGFLLFLRLLLLLYERSFHVWLNHQFQQGKSVTVKQKHLEAISYTIASLTPCGQIFAPLSTTIPCGAPVV